MYGFNLKNEIKASEFYYYVNAIHKSVTGKEVDYSYSPETVALMFD